MTLRIVMSYTRIIAPLGREISTHPHKVMPDLALIPLKLNDITKFHLAKLEMQKWCNEVLGPELTGAGDHGTAQWTYNGQFESFGFLNKETAMRFMLRWNGELI